MNKQILLSLGTLVVAGAVIAGGTGAFFSDTETSTGNVFTAGDVNLELSGLAHTYLAEEDEANLPPNYVAIDTANNSFQFGDLKPLDWGSLDGELTNTGNDAFVCAQVVDPSTATESPFDDLLKFRVNNGLGLTVADTLTLTGLNEWFSLDLGNPALAMASGDTLPSSVEYCFGDFEAGGDCVIDENVDYNAAQGQTLTLDIEYYAVQQRNNGDFTCGGLNDDVVTGPNTETIVAGASSDFDVLGDSTLSTIGTGSWMNEDDSGDKTFFWAFYGVGANATLGTFTIDDIKSISYKTNKPGVQSDVDFYYSIYTQEDGFDDEQSWYGYRLNMEPSYSLSLNAPANQWNTWNTDPGTNQTTFFDEENLNAFGVASGQPTLQDLQASSAFDWNSVNALGDVTAIDYGAETVKGIAFSTGSGWDQSLLGNIDEAVIELNNGNTLTIDFEPAS